MQDGYKLMFLVDMHLKTLPTRNGWEADVSPALWAVLEFGKYFKPDETVLGGDFMEFNIISKYETDDFIKREGRRLRHDFELGNQILDKIDSFTKGKKVFIVGNHDARLATWIASHPQIEGLISLGYNLKLEERGYKIIPEGKLYSVGHANFGHGWYWNLHHAKKTVLEVGDNIFYGHVHDVQQFTKFNYKQRPIIASSVGCLCDLDPEWRKGRPNRWVNGFGVLYFFKNGNFTFYNPIIIDGKFIWNGKVFKGEK